MVFSCFRFGRQKKSTENSNTFIPPKETQNSNSTKKLPGNNQQFNGKVKLAPRTAILQTPKQAVGNRITRATAKRRRPNLNLRKETASLSSSSHQSSKSDLASSSNDQQMDQTTTTKKMERPHHNDPAYPKETPPTTRPISPIGMVSVFNNNNDELRAALAKRAAQFERKKEDE